MSKTLISDTNSGRVLESAPASSLRPSELLASRSIELSRLAATIVLMAMMATGCGAGGTEEPASSPPAAGATAAPLSVYVVNYPLMYFAQRVGGAHVAVVFPAPADGDPAFWQPGVETITAYQNADLIVRNGATYAKWIERATLPESKMVDTASAFGDRLIEIDSGVTHSHGPEGEHTHGEIAFTTWLDPQLAMLQAEAVAAAISAALPAASTDFFANLGALRGDLEALDQRLEAVTEGLGDTPLLGSHPVYQYLARRYALNLRSVHFEPDENPDEKSWADLERLHGAHPAATMLWEAEPLPEVAERLRAMGIESIVFDPAGNRPASGDFLAVMTANADNLESRLAR